MPSPSGGLQPPETPSGDTPIGRGFLAFLIMSARPSELPRNSSCQTQWEALGGVLPTAAWQRSIARSKKIATATWWLQPQSEQQPRWSWPCQFLAEIALGASKHPLNSLAGLPLADLRHPN